MIFCGERALPHFVSFNAFRHPLTPHRLAGKGCKSVVWRLLKVLGGANMTPIRRTGKQNPLELQRVLCVNIGPEMKLSLL